MESFTKKCTFLENDILLFKKRKTQNLEKIFKKLCFLTKVMLEYVRYTK